MSNYNVAMMDIHSPLSLIPNTHTSTVAKLKKLGLHTFQDLLSYFPVRYVDYRLTSKIGQVQAGETVTVSGRVKESKNHHVRRNFSIQKVTIFDETGELELTWFNQPYIVRMTPPNAVIAAAGTIERQGGSLIMKPIEYEVQKPGSLQGVHTGRIVPIYAQRFGLTSRLLREKIAWVLAHTRYDNMIDWLPDDIRSRHNLLEYSKTIRAIHAPKNDHDIAVARRRLSFDELFTLHISALVVRQNWQKKSVIRQLVLTPAITKHIETFVHGLPFSLTKSQKDAWLHILRDLQKQSPMNRLLQGDVGSGKTVVASLASFFVALQGLSTLFMCPTEVLAKQHADTLQRLFENHKDISIKLVTSRSTAMLNDQKPSIIVGTHALIASTRSFENVGLIIIDEQHRFGVVQRGLLKEKGGIPHVLTMTATPIPRTVALTIFGDLDMSVLYDKPSGRKTTKTYVVPDTKREKAYAWIAMMMQTHGTQTYIVCPRIEQNDTDDASAETVGSMRAAVAEAKRLQENVFPQFRVGLLHGKLKASEKDTVMQKFTKRELDILVTTTVVEVGIDVPNATIMMIEGAERFGLAQLHQLRGRVGRNEKQSYCLLFTSDGVKHSARLHFFAKTTDGMRLAEYDFKQRGSGDIYGTAQSGHSSVLQMASIFDYELVARAKDAAYDFLKEYSPLKHPLVAKRLEKLQSNRVTKD
jgi:ATP-dependent DNA helicase RecG